MAAGADNVQMNDQVAPVVHNESNAIANQGAAMSDKGSLSSINAMKPADTARGALPDFDISGDKNPYADLTSGQQQEMMKKFGAGANENNIAAEAVALRLPANASSQQVDTALGKLIDAEMPTYKETHAAKQAVAALEHSGNTQLFNDMSSTDPKVAHQAAENYFNAVFKNDTPDQLDALRNQFHADRGHVTAAEDLMGVPDEKASTTFMNALGDVLDKHAPAMTHAEKQAEKAAGNRPSLDFLIRSSEF